MSGGKHTAGPWMAAASPSSVVGWPVVGPMGRSICNVSWMPKKAYPDVSEADYASFNAECEANARLIAAAPALLAAAKEMVEIDDRDALTDPDRAATDEYRSEVWAKLRAAIAKAKGLPSPPSKEGE